MTVLRSDIERALNDLISNEEGMRFQGLAVVLAKQRWPDFISSERKKDLGADAIGSGRILACSLTAALGKIQGDARKIKANFNDVATLVFATPNGVTNTTAQHWAEEIRREFGYELKMMPREDIITSLMDPSNTSLFRTHLGLPVAFEAATTELIRHVREAVSELIATWSVRLAERPLIELRALKIDQDGKDAAVLFSLGDIRASLDLSRRVVIEAPAGRGKTTTLVQLANHHSSLGELAFLIDLPAWIQSRSDLLQFIGGMPQFRYRRLDAETLWRLHKDAHFSFLLNGWNEIAESDSDRAGQALRELDRNFPSAGILVATRTHHITPPLRGAVRLRLLPVSRTERAHYLQQRLGGRADELRRKLDGDVVLDELTRTPLILSEVTDLFEADAPIPKTKMRVLKGTVRLHEQLEEHSSYLALAPLDGRGKEYLAALATSMTEKGAVTTPDEPACTIVSEVTTRLRDSGQIATVPEPSAILKALCAHHLLERVAYPTISFRFEHQQFQEFYVASLLKHRLLALAEEDDPQGVLEFTKRYVNQPVWTEPLRMIAEDIGVASTASPDDANIRSGTLLVRMALECDPVYAAELSYLCGPSVWKEIRGDFSERLRSLYQAPDKHHRELALAGMLATGSDEFKDIILPLLTSEDQQVRLGTYRMRSDFHLSSLGPDWQRIVSDWKGQIRAEFVTELLHFGHTASTLAPFALRDSDLKVRVAAVSALAWISSYEDFAQLLATLDDDIFEAALPELPTEAIPEASRHRALTVYGKLYIGSSDPVRRLRLLLHISELGDTNIASQMKDELVRCEAENVKKLGGFLLKPILEIVRRTEPEWVSHWVANQIVGGTLWHDHWITFVTAIPEELKERLLQRFENEDLGQTRYSGSMSVLAACADAALAQRVFAKLCELRGIIASAPDERHDLEWAIERLLDDLFRLLPVDIAVEGLSDHLSGNIDAIELTVVARLLSRVGRDEFDLRSTLIGALRQNLRDYLKKGVPVMLQREDFSGLQKANLASALVQVGEPEDMTILLELIRADIERVRRGREARAKGSQGMLANGATMSYSNWHARAVACLDSNTADAVLLQFLNEPEYERDAAGALIQLASTSQVQARFGRKRDYEHIWEARASRLPRGFNEERRKRYAMALQERVTNILEEGARTGQINDSRLKGLTKALAAIDSFGSINLVFRALTIPGRFNGWAIVGTLETLLFNGVTLPTEETLKLFDSVEEQVRPNLHNNQGIWLLVDALCLLPFVDNPSGGIQKIRQVVGDLKIRAYRLGSLATALGHSRCSEALGILRELACDEPNLRMIEDSWIDAVAALDSPEARQLLMSFVDSEICGLPFEMKFERMDILAARLVELARRDRTVEEHLLQLCSSQLPALKRSLLARVISKVGTPEADLAALNLIDDNASPPVPYETWKQIEAAFVEHKPHGKDTNVYTLAPRSSNKVRARLFEMATTDERRMKSASSLLGQIDVWRVEHGRPNGEPRSLAVECESSWPTVGVARLRPDNERAG
jgi:hypothetical protein